MRTGVVSTSPRQGWNDAVVPSRIDETGTYMSDDVGAGLMQWGSAVVVEKRETGGLTCLRADAGTDAYVV